MVVVVIVKVTVNHYCDILEQKAFLILISSCNLYPSVPYIYNRASNSHS
jgi:hypothetical protein